MSKGFDIVVGNPPYINTRELSKMDNGELLKSVWLKIPYKSAYKGFDIAVLFVERTKDLLKEDGIWGNIITNKFLVTDYGIKIRKFILKHYGIQQIIDVSNFSVFKNVGIYPIIAIFSMKDEDKMHICASLDTYAEFQDNSIDFESIDKSIFNKLKNKIFAIHITEENHPVIAKMLKGSVFLKDEDAECGITGFNYTKIGNHIIDREPEGDGWKFVVSGNITPFKITWGTPIHYFSNNWEHPYLPDNRDLTDGKRRLYNTKNKVLIRGIAKRLSAGVDEEGFALGTSVYGIMHKDYDPYYLSGIYNSDLVDFFYNSLYKSKHLQGGFVSYNKGQLLTIPLKKYDSSNGIHTRIRNLAKDLANERSAEKRSELNELVYELYGLSSEMKDIVEHSYSNMEEDDVK